MKEFTEAQQQRFLAALKRLALSHPPIRLELDAFSAWTLLSTLQLALRHPQLGRMAAAETIRSAVGKLKEACCTLEPDLRELADAGDDPQFDQRGDDPHG